MMHLLWMKAWGYVDREGAERVPPGPHRIDVAGRTWAFCAGLGVVIAVRGRNDAPRWTPVSPSQDRWLRSRFFMPLRGRTPTFRFDELRAWLGPPDASPESVRGDRPRRGTLSGVRINRALLAAALEHLAADTVRVRAVSIDGQQPAVFVYTDRWRVLLAGMRVEDGAARAEWRDAPSFPSPAARIRG